MEVLMSLFDFIMHIDQHLSEFVTEYGLWIYAILFLIIFVETGVVVMPFLPGDSLLFAAGMLAAQESNNLNVWLMIAILLLAAILGDTLNYSIGKKVGYRATKIKIFGRSFVKEEHLEKTHSFYQKYGSKTIVIARFVPIVRTLAPFVGGIGNMPYKTFITYNIVGAILWVVGLTLIGYFLGNIPLVQNNFSKVILIITLLSILPIIIELLKERFGKKTNSIQ
ncbi:membrane-associated protein [Chishuiella changwenlii]|uniref:Membrane protein n=1 Tax=Chishuiella changwenlii TaxID=1434701 RepID=A0A1M6T0E6_9FLAO|nr:DedA family protein [Chishuiella changwenlii]GGE94417.1 membrane protein [Chishuiella changwenlii]SHK50405.1 membrane-associated protein [Chishuiella changwenlii]